MDFIDRREEIEDICMSYGMTLRACRLSQMTKEDANIVKDFLDDEEDLYAI